MKIFIAVIVVAVCAYFAWDNYSNRMSASPYYSELRVKFGDHMRTILVGMRQERSDPREIERRQALFVVNLEPRSMMGEISEGMLFDIGYADGLLPVLATPERAVPNGTRAG